MSAKLHGSCGPIRLPCWYQKKFVLQLKRKPSTSTRKSELGEEVKITAVEKKINEIVNRLEKTKEERFPDLAAEKECRDREERNEKKAQIQEMKRKEKEEMKRKKELEELSLSPAQLVNHLCYLSEIGGSQLIGGSASRTVDPEISNVLASISFEQLLKVASPAGHNCSVIRKDCSISCPDCDSLRNRLRCA
ncbi:CCD25 protein, partial [Polypterus senegalus]